MNIFTPVDWLVVALYFTVILGIAWWVIRQKQDSTTDYFLAGRHVGWFVIGASIFASNIGSEHIVGLAGTAAKTGVVMGHYELHSWLVLLLGLVFVSCFPGGICTDQSICYRLCRSGGLSGSYGDQFLDRSPHCGGAYRNLYHPRWIAGGGLYRSPAGDRAYRRVCDGDGDRSGKDRWLVSIDRGGRRTTFQSVPAG